MSEIFLYFLFLELFLLNLEMKTMWEYLPFLILSVCVNLDLYSLGSHGSSDSKESACNAGDLGLKPGLGRSSGEGNGNPLQYSCLENPMD